ncbi:C-GCAxxG-C-C family protein [Candidatus Bipolaricaulota bacterium]|nr:C-GCAxxG-C-C family protein [Candidatus Bipolaricaulota bacterium]
MTQFDTIVEQIDGPRSTASYSGETSPEEIRRKLLDVIARSAFNNLRAYSNCCRSTLWAIQTHLRLPDTATLRASSTLAGGIAGTGETCGAVLGALMAIGQAMGSDGYHEAERDLQARAAAKTFVDSFTEAIGSTRCPGIQQSIIGWVCDDPSKTQAWHEANGPIGCAAACGLAARLAAEQILLHSDTLNG